MVHQLASKAIADFSIYHLQLSQDTDSYGPYMQHYRNDWRCSSLQATLLRTLSVINSRHQKHHFHQSWVHVLTYILYV